MKALRTLALCVLAATSWAWASGEAASAERTPLADSLESAGFQLIKHRRGIRVYKHRRAEDIRIAGEGVLPAPPAAVRALLLDYDRHAGRVPRLRDSRILRREPGALLVYQRLDLPVISDRDFVLRVRWGDEGPDSFITYEAAPGEGPPPQDGVVRVTMHSGSWQLRPVDNGQATFARYQTHMELGGWVPKWMARGKAGNDVPGLFRALCKMLGKTCG